MYKIFKNMLNFFKKLFEKVKELFSDSFDKLRLFSGVAVKVTAVIKEVVENPLLGLAVDLTKTTKDNQILAKVLVIVPQVTAHIAIAHGIIQATDDNSDTTGALIEHLRKISPAARASFWVMLSGEINKALADGKISLAEAIALAQLVYAEKIKG
jgi:ribosome-associated translation inhibitor RaiA